MNLSEKKFFFFGPLIYGKRNSLLTSQFYTFNIHTVKSIHLYKKKKNLTCSYENIEIESIDSVRE